MAVEFATLATLDVRDVKTFEPLEALEALERLEAPRRAADAIGDTWATLGTNA